MATYITHSANETTALGEKLGKVLTPGSIVAFTGGLGAGKTTFSRGLAKGLGSSSPVSSPTYAIVNLYEGKIPLAHFDLYRLETADDLEAAGFFDYLDAGAVLALEWSERMPLPEPPTVTISMQTVDDSTRRITIEGAPDL